MSPLLESFTPDEWALIALGCIAVILVPSIIILGLRHLLVSLPSFIIRHLVQGRAAIPETADVAPVPAAVPAADIDAEWADIETQIEKSK
jgi:hypothetical protein